MAQSAGDPRDHSADLSGVARAVSSRTHCPSSWLWRSITWAVREPVQVGAGVEKPELQVVAAAVAVVADVDRLVEVLDEVHEEFQRPLLLLPGGVRIQEYPPEILDLADHAAFGRQYLASYRGSVIGTFK